MKVIKAYPPNFVELTRHFPIKGKPGILYSWGNVLYNPSGVKVTPWIMAHEEVHGKRQLQVGVEKWWGPYIGHPAFRYEEELLAHQQEWKTYREVTNTTNLNYLDTIAHRLSGPMYGSMVSYEEARDAISRNDWTDWRGK